MALLLMAIVSSAAQAEALQVLHWWTSASERKAADLLAAKLNFGNIEWRDAAIPGGAGVGAGKVLKSRVLAGNAPEVMQLNGVSISEWADLGLLLELDAVAGTGGWNKLLLPTVWTLVQNRGHVVAAPLGIHRINTLFFNQKIFRRLGIEAPRTWADFERSAALLKRAGVIPLAQSSEPWQVATLFETLVLAEGGPAFYRELFVKKNPRAFSDPRLAHALKHLRSLREWMPSPIKEQSWSEVARQLADGEAGMFVMGDWVKGELNAWGLVVDENFGCAAVPETAKYHLYDVDSLAMVVTDRSHWVEQERLAQIAMSAAVQADYNQIKGSIPVLRNPDLSRMDSCSRDSWKLFARGNSVQVPSLVHRMATDEISRDAFIAEVHRFFMDDQLTVEDTQHRLGAILRALTRNRPENNTAQDVHR